MARPVKPHKVAILQCAHQGLICVGCSAKTVNKKDSWAKFIAFLLIVELAVAGTDEAVRSN
jgi:hypothetical protein